MIGSTRQASHSTLVFCGSSEPWFFIQTYSNQSQANTLILSKQMTSETADCKTRIHCHGFHPPSKKAPERGQKTDLYHAVHGTSFHINHTLGLQLHPRRWIEALGPQGWVVSPHSGALQPLLVSYPHTSDDATVDRLAGGHNSTGGRAPLSTLRLHSERLIDHVGEVIQERCDCEAIEHREQGAEVTVEHREHKQQEEHLVLLSCTWCFVEADLPQFWNYMMRLLCFSFFKGLSPCCHRK